MIRDNIRHTTIILAFTALTACGTTPKTESDDYNDMRGGTVYRTYQKLSIEAMKPVVKEYNNYLSRQNKSPVGDTHVHALLSLIWIAALEPKYALAESEYALNHAADPRDRYATLLLQSIAMHENGWNYLGKKSSLEARSIIKTANLSNSYDNTRILAHVAGSILAYKEGNIPYVADEIRELGAATNQDWLVKVGDATQDVYQGAHSRALAKLEDVKTNSSLTELERNKLDDVISAVKTGGKNVIVNVAKPVVTLAVITGIQSSPLTGQIIQKLPEEHRNKVNGYITASP